MGYYCNQCSLHVRRSRWRHEDSRNHIVKKLHQDVEDINGLFPVSRTVKGALVHAGIEFEMFDGDYRKKKYIKIPFVSRDVSALCHNFKGDALKWLLVQYGNNVGNFRKVFSTLREMNSCKATTYCQLQWEQTPKGIPGRSEEMQDAIRELVRTYRATDFREVQRHFSRSADPLGDRLSLPEDAYLKLLRSIKNVCAAVEKKADRS